MHHIHANRRAVIGALATLPAICAVSSHATVVMPMGDASIERAWRRRQEAHAAYNALPDDNEPDVDGCGPGERELWDIIDEAEEEIRSSIATTTKGAMIQLWCAMYHSITGREDEKAVERGDFAALDREDSTLDRSECLVLAALRSLQAMEA